MTRAGSSGRKRLWKKVVVALIIGVVAVGSLIFWKRRALAIWYMEGNKKVQETVILTMLENARPIIERDLNMSLPQKILSTMAGKRNEKERRTDALQDVRTFAELGFENHRLRFKDVHTLSSVHGVDLHGFDYALEWNRDNSSEILTAFNINFLKRRVGKMQINQSCSYFAELKSYVEKKARKN
jgi:hypothetical protein